MKDAMKANICMFVHAVFEKAEQAGVPIPTDKVTSVVEAGIDAALQEEVHCAREGIELSPNPEAMYQQGQDYCLDRIEPAAFV
jgi:hypothetical protein